MNKVILEEFKKPIYAIDIALYVIFVISGFILLNFSEIGLNDPTPYAPFIFYTFAFFTILAYFANRRKGDYELLMFGLIDVIVATFILINMYALEGKFIMADSVLIYSIAIVINKAIMCNKLLKERNLNFFPKVSVTILLIILGVFIVSSLYNKIEVGVMILGYYFIIFGLLSLLEPLMAIISQNKSFHKYVFEMLSYEEEIAEREGMVEEKEEKKEEKKIRAKKVTKSSIKKPAAKKVAATKAKKPIKNRTIKKIKK